MTIAEKLQRIAENEERVFDAGRRKGASEGGGDTDPDKIIHATATGNGVVRIDEVSEVKHKVKVVTSAGAKVTVQGKNLFDVNSITCLVFNSNDTTTSKGYQENGILYALHGSYGGACYWDGFVCELPVGTYTISCDAYTNMDDTRAFVARFIDIDTDERVNPIGDSTRFPTKGKKARVSWTINITKKARLGLSLQGLGSANNSNHLDVQFSNIQIEAGGLTTAYEPYIETLEDTADYDGIVRADSISPAMTIVSGGAEMTVEYRKSWGMDYERDAFWYALQSGGAPKDYSCSFGAAWTEAVFYPRHDIVPTNAYMMFRGSKMEIDLEARLQSLGVQLDFSNATATQCIFQNSEFTRIGLVDLSASTAVVAYDNCFASCKKLVSVGPIVLRGYGKTDFNANTFKECEALEDVSFLGVLSCDVDLHWSGKLTRASIYSLLFAADASMNLDHRNHFTITLSRTAVDRAFEMSEGANDGTESDAWRAIVNNTESYYTITLI